MPQVLEIFSFFLLTDHVFIWLHIIPFHLMKINGIVHSLTLIFHWCSEVLRERQRPWSTFFCPSPFVRFVWNCLPILPLKFGNCSTFSTSPNFVCLSFALMTETCSALSCIFGIPFAVCKLKVVCTFFERNIYVHQVLLKKILANLTHRENANVRHVGLTFYWTSISFEADRILCIKSIFPIRSKSAKQSLKM